MTPDELQHIYGNDAAHAGKLLASGASEAYLRGMTWFHLRKRGRPSGPNDVAAVIASFRGPMMRTTHEDPRPMEEMEP